MLSKFLVILLLTVTTNYSFAQSKKINKEAIKNDIVEVERKFNNDLKLNGVEYAFYKYAADNAVIKREKDSLIIGKEAIRNYYSDASYKNAVAEWTPNYVDVSDDGTMAYTYGRYTWTFNDKEGKQMKYEGVFHTVWKKMIDGTWKYVWD